MENIENNIGVEIIENLFQLNRSKSWVLSSYEIRDKISKLFPGKWGEPSIKKIERTTIFGLKSGVILTSNGDLIFCVDSKRSKKISLKNLEFRKFICEINPNFIRISDKLTYDFKIPLSKDESEFFSSFLNEYDEKITELILEIKEKKKQEELQILNKVLNDKKEDFINEFDKDRNGELDITEGEDYGVLLKKHQQEIIKIDRDYVLKFVKISNYLNTKRDNLRQIFKILLRSKDEKSLEKFINVTKNEIHSYNLILFNSLNMITSIVNDDMITFFEIYERFDMLNIFDSKHEKDLSNKLTTMGDNLKNLIYTMESIGENISNELSDLKYVTEESTRVLGEQLTSINSSIDTNNLLTTIQTYQMYKVNKNTKRLN